MGRKNIYSRKTLEELIRGYANAVENDDWQESRISKQMIVNEVYARIKNTFDMLDEVPEDADQIYEMLIAPMGMERDGDEGQQKEEIREAPDPLRGIQEILLAARESNNPLSLDCTMGECRITLNRILKEAEGSGGEKTTALLERIQSLRQLSEAELYRLAADELEGHGKHPEAVRMVYEHEEKQLSDRPIRTAKEKIHARLKAKLKLSLLLLENGYEDTAVDNAWQAIKSTHRGRQIRMCEHLHCNIWS